MSICDSVKHVKRPKTYYTCLFLDNIPISEKTYCSSCFERKHLNFEFKYQCNECKRFMNIPCFTHEDNNYCYFCLDIDPETMWPVVSEISDDIKDIFQIEKSMLPVSLVADLLNNNITHELKYWRTIIHNKVMTIPDRKHKEKLKYDSLNYTKITRLGDSIKRFVPDISEHEAQIAAKRVDLHNVNSEELVFEDAESLIHWLVGR